MSRALSGHFYILVLLLCLPGLSFGSCREKAEIMATHRPVTVIFAGAAGVIGGVAVVGFPFFAPAAAGTAVVAYWLKNKPKRLVKLLDEASVCRGPRIDRLYRLYSESTATPVGQSEFCQIVHEADEDETLCPLYLPSRTRILRAVERKESE